MEIRKGAGAIISRYDKGAGRCVLAAALRAGAFVFADCYGYIPAIQLCVCYDRLGQLQKAQKYNELAGHFKPNNASYLHNKQYFDKILKNKGNEQ